MSARLHDRGAILRRPSSMASLLLVLLFALALRIAWAAEDAPVPPFVRSPPQAGARSALAAPLAAGQPGVHIAGSGSGMVVCRALRDSLWSTDPAGVRVLVHDSIGSTGGVRAVADGVVDIGVITRPLHDHERALGLSEIPLARVPVLVVAHPSVRDGAISGDELRAIYRGERDHWRDEQPLVLLLRERGDSSHAAIARVLPDFGAIDEAAISARRARILYHDEELVRAVLAIEGSVGVSDAVLVESAREQPHVLAIDGQRPTPDAVLRGAYPFVKQMAFVLRADAPPEARALVDLARSEAGAAVLRALGAVPAMEAE